MKPFRNYVNEKLRIAPKRKPKKSTFKGVEPDSKGWKKGKVAIGIGTHTSDGTTINLQKGKTLHYHPDGDKYIGSTNPKDPGTYFRMDKNRVNESTENSEYDPDLGEMNIGEMSAKAHYKSVMKGGKGKGFVVSTPIDRERYPNREKEGLEGPYKSRKSGKIFYYDKKAGKYYDPGSDMFLDVSDVMEDVDESRIVRHGDGNYVSRTDGEKVKTVTGNKSKAKRFSKSVAKRIANQPRFRLDFQPDGSAKKTPLKGTKSGTVIRDEVEQVDELDTKTMKSYVHKASGQVRSDLSTGKHSPKTNKRARGVAKAKTDLDMRKIAGKDYRKRMGEEVEEVTEKFEMEFADKETAQKFMSQIVRLRLGSATGTKDGKVTVHGPQQAGVGSPTKAHQQMSKIMKKFGGKIISTDEGPRMKKVFEAPKIKIKLDPKKKIGYEVKSVGPGGKKTVTKRRDMPGKTDVGESKRVYGPGSDPRLKKLSKDSKSELASMANSFGHSGGPYLDVNNVHNLTKKAVDLCIRDAEKAIKNMGPKIPADFKKKRSDGLVKMKKELGIK